MLGVFWNPQELLLKMGTKIFKVDASWAEKLTKTRVQFLLTPTVSLSFVQVFVGENTNLFKVLFQPALFVCYSIRDNKGAVVGTHNKILRCRSEHLPAHDVM